MGYPKRPFDDDPSAQYFDTPPLPKPEAAPPPFYQGIATPQEFVPPPSPQPEPTPQPQPEVQPQQEQVYTDPGARIVGSVITGGGKPALTPDEKKLGTSMEEQKRIAEDAGQVQSDLRKQAADVYSAGADADAASAVAQQKVMEDGRRDWDAKQEELLSNIDSLNKAEVTPKTFGQLWAKKDTGQKILAGISIGLSSIGQNLQSVAGYLGGDSQAFSRQSNAALKFIDNAIEEDLRKQQSTYDRLQNTVGQNRKALTDIRAGVDDRIDNLDRQRILAWEKSKKIISSLENKMVSEEQKATARNLKEEITQKQADLNMKLWQRARQRVAQQQQFVMEVAGQRFLASPKEAVKMTQDNRKIAVDEGKLRNDERKLQNEEDESRPEIPGLKKTGEKSPKLKGTMTNDLVQLAGNYSWTLDLMKRAKALAEKGTNWSDADRIAADSIQKDLVDGRLKGRGYGVPSAGEFARIESVIKDPIKLTNWYERNNKRYEILIQHTENEANKKFRPYGYTLEDSASSDVRPISKDSSNRVYKAE